MSLFDFFKKKSSPPIKVIQVAEPLEARIKYFSEKPTTVTMSIKTFSDKPIEIYFHAEKEKAELLLSELLTVLHKVDEIVQQYPKTEFEIGYIDIYNDNAKICYYGLMVNTEFDVEVYKDAELWYCSRQGAATYNPPKRI